jgi:hypothetical protein
MLSPELQAYKGESSAMKVFDRMAFSLDFATLDLLGEIAKKGRAHFLPF